VSAKLTGYLNFCFPLKKAKTTATTKIYQLLDCHGRQRALAMTDHDHDKKVNSITRNGDPSPYPLPQGARDQRPRQSGKRHFKYPVASRHPFSTKRGIENVKKNEVTNPTLINDSVFVSFFICL
jgi:hypothetical protein